MLPNNKPSSHLERYAESDLTTSRGVFRIVVYRDKRNGSEHVALLHGDVKGHDGVPVRIHSECITSEVFGSLRCDCRSQLDRALDFIAQSPRGVVVYLRQEGRGIGLGNKIRAYALQQSEGIDTVEANLRLGFPDDVRRYDIASEILRSLGVRSVDLITNNPLKIAGLIDEGIPVLRRIPSRTLTNPLNLEYLKTKRDRSGHLIEFLAEEDSEAKAG